MRRAAPIPALGARALLAPTLFALALVLAGCGAPIAGDDAPPDPGADRLGWEAGYWHNESISVTAGDGLDAREREAVVSRAMARVERIRGLEFDERVPVRVIDRDDFAASAAGGSPSAALRTFEDAKFAALFLVGSDGDSLDTRNASRNRSIAGYYDPGADAIVVVSDASAPTLDGEGTLAHELVHALQDQHFSVLDGSPPATRDGANAWRGLIEGDAQAVETLYLERCGEEWTCLGGSDAGSGPTSAGTSGGESGGESAGTSQSGADAPGDDDAGRVHLGVQVLDFFPYSDGPGLIAHLRADGGWTAVNAAYDRPPETSTAVVYPARYGSFDRRDVAPVETPRGGWERVRPPDRPDHARLGQSGLVAMFAYTLYDDYNRSAVVDPRAFLNTGPTGAVNATDPLNYDLAPARGWLGDRLAVYRRGEATAYVWRLAWSSPGAAERFAGRYRALLSHWGADRIGVDTWRLARGSPFDGAIHLDVAGDSITVTRAPNRSALSALADGGQ